MGLDYKMVLDELRPFEINNLLSHRHLVYKNNFEAMRQICFTIAQVNSKKQLDPQKLIKFPWDEGDLSEKEEMEEIEEMRKIAMSMNN